MLTIYWSSASGWFFREMTLMEFGDEASEIKKRDEFAARSSTIRAVDD